MTAGKRRELRELETNLKVVKHEPAQLLEEAPAKDRRTAGEDRPGAEHHDTFDLRYKNYEKRPEPSSQAVMPDGHAVRLNGSGLKICWLQRFYILLYLFLSRTYKNMRWSRIRHHTQAKRWMVCRSSTRRRPAAPSCQRPETDG